MVSKHPSPELLVEYVSGALSIARAISITTHLHFCQNCRQATVLLTEIGGHLLRESDVLTVSDGLLEKVLTNLDESAGEGQVTGREVVSPPDQVIASLPLFVQRFFPDGCIKWRFVSPSLKTASISVGEEAYELAVDLINAGGKAPEHDHRGREITVVLKGSFSDAEGVYHSGDFMTREVGSVHRPFASLNEPCICLSVLSAPIKLTGLNRIFNPFLSFSPR